MVEKDQIAMILKYDRGEALVLLATALLTVFRDITEGIAVGVTLGSLIFMHRMAQIVEVETQEKIWEEEDRPDGAVDSCDAGVLEHEHDPEFVVYRISGPFFFGAASMIAAALDHIGKKPKAFVLDLSRVPLADGGAAHALHGFLDRERRDNVRVYICGASRGVRRTLIAHGVNSRTAHFSADEAGAREHFLAHPTG
jgi:SulP family sulfate permease